MTRYIPVILLLLAFPSLAHDVEITGPGTLKFEFIPKAAAPVPPPPATQPTPPNEEPVKQAVLLHPKERPAWCDDDVNVCYRKVDQPNSLYDVVGYRTRPHTAEYFSKEGPYREGGECKIRTRPGIMFSKPAGSSKSWFCQPLFGGGTDLHVQVEPGHRYGRCFHSWAHGDFILSSPRGTPFDQQPVLLAYKSYYGGSETGLNGNACIAAREGQDVTVRGIVVKNVEKISGRWTPHIIKDPFYRCVQSGAGITTLIDSQFENCGHGMQGGGEEWIVVNTKFLNCDYNGRGDRHCLYGLYQLQKITVTGSTLKTCGGHAFKGVVKEAVVEHSHLETGIRPDCNSGTVYHNSYGGTVLMNTLTILKNRDVGNDHIFGTGNGSGNPERCQGVDGVRGKWTLKNVAITAGIPKHPNLGIHEITGGCPDLADSQWIDGGDNTFRIVDATGEGEVKPLMFKNHRPVLYRTPY